MDPSDAPLDLLRRALPGLPPRLREVGQFLNNHAFDASTRSMRGLAAAAGVNPASFTRLAQALGYAGWDELRDALIEARRPDPASPYSSRVPPPQPDAPPNPEWVAAAMIGSDAAGLAHVDAAAIVALAVEVTGNKPARLYDGSWSDWGARPDLPVATGE